MIECISWPVNYGLEYLEVNRCRYSEFFKFLEDLLHFKTLVIGCCYANYYGNQMNSEAIKNFQSSFASWTINKITHRSNRIQFHFKGKWVFRIMNIENEIYIISVNISRIIKWVSMPLVSTWGWGWGLESKKVNTHVIKSRLRYDPSIYIYILISLKILVWTLFLSNGSWKSHYRIWHMN